MTENAVGGDGQDWPDEGHCAVHRQRRTARDGRRYRVGADAVPRALHGRRRARPKGRRHRRHADGLQQWHHDGGNDVTRCRDDQRTC